MNYLKIYDQLIKTAKAKPKTNEYKEQHHIIPRCMGGSDDKDNLVYLTPEEHFVAHQLLVKIYPENEYLIAGASMMSMNRPTNKMYGWIRRRLSAYMSTLQKGTGNSQYGSFWICNTSTGKTQKCRDKNNIPDGWQIGRIIKNKEDTITYKNKTAADAKRIIVEQNKKELVDRRKQLIYNSDINFGKIGWTCQVAKLLEMKPQKIKNWFIKNMPDFYENNCFKYKIK